MKSQLRLASAISVVAVLGLAACSDDDQQAGEPAVSEDDSPGSVAPDGAEGNADDDSSPARIEEITWSMPYPVSSLDPARAFNTPAMAGMSIGLEGLLRFDRSGRLEPLLATEVANPDPTTYIYTLREDVTFWDGSAMTSDDVVFSMQRHLDGSASQQAVFYDSVRSIEASGPFEVTVTLDRPDATWQYVPAVASQVVSKAYAESVGEDLGGPDALTLGTGPYRFVDFAPDQELTAERYDGYWGDPPAVDRVTIRTIEDDTARLLALRTGEIDGAFYVPAASFQDWKDLDNAVVHTTAGADSYMFIFNTSEPPFDDVRVRRAIAHALDREGIAQQLLGEQATAAELYMPRAVWNGLLGDQAVDEFYASLPSYDFDMAAAAEELAASGYPDGFDFTVHVPEGADPLTSAALVLGESLKSLGVTMNIEELPASQWLTKIYGHDGLTFETLGESSVFPDPAYYASFLDGDRAVPNGTNYASFIDEEATSLFDLQNETPDQEERIEALRELTRIAAEELPYLGVYWLDTNVAVSTSLAYDELGPWFWLTNWAAYITPAS